MSLEQELAGLSGSVNNFLNVAFEQHAGDHLEDVTLLTVGVDKEFPDLQSAWNSLIGKVISNNVTIQVDDGVYEARNITLRYQPYAEKIAILGNQANPEQCVFDVVPQVSDGRAIGISIFNIRNLLISGFKFRNARDPSGVLGRTGGIGLSIGGHARVFAHEAGLIFENCDSGVRIGTHSVGSFAGTRFINCGIAASVAESSYGVFIRADVAGPGWSTDPDAARVYGLFCAHGGFCHAQDAVIRDCYYGIFAFSNGSIGWCRGARVENTRHGFLAQWNGLLDAQISVSPGSLAQDPDGVGCRAEGCETGFYAIDMGNLFCQRSVADGCVRGYFADRAGQVRADSSSALNNTTGAYQVGQSSLVYAFATQANLSGNASDYNVANGVQGSSGGWMHYS